MSYESAYSKFEMAFNNVSANKKVAFKESWANGTGYLDHAMEPGNVDFDGHDVVACVDNHDRKILIYRTAVGNVVLFERYPGQDVLVINRPTILSSLGVIKDMGRQDYDGVASIVGIDGYKNSLPVRLEKFVAAYNNGVAATAEAS